LIGYIY